MLKNSLYLNSITNFVFMSLNRILAFSSSRVGNGKYLETAIPFIKELLGDTSQQIVFIPFASVENDFDEYTIKVKKGLETLPYTITTLTPDNAAETINNAAAIMVGGGNTFKLLHDIYYLKLLDIIRDKVNKGVPYIGWSAGSNILGPTIGTTNDMPIIEPKSFNALGLLPFQVNPHYTNVTAVGHNGETRDQRLQEFIQLNPGLPVVGLPEGTGLRLLNGRLQMIGELPALLFTGDENEIVKKEIGVDEDLTFLL